MGRHFKLSPKTAMEADKERGPVYNAEFQTPILETYRHKIDMRKLKWNFEKDNLNVRD